MIKPGMLFQFYENGVYAGISLSVTIIDEGDRTKNELSTLTYYDTNRARIFRGTKTRESNAGFSFKTEQGNELEFRLATIASYDKEVRPTVEGTVPAFRYETDLHEWYRRRFG